MKRLIYSELLTWKHHPDKKPLLLQGARQVGKTYILKELAVNEYSNFAYFNFEEDNTLISIFDKSLSPPSVIHSLELYLGKKISPKSTLIFFDEIQAAPRAITSLKYFCEEAPEYDVVAAGSLLGVSVGKTSSFPVGKVNFLTLYPMNFSEYLAASSFEMLKDYIEEKGDLEPIPEAIHEKIMEHYKMFLYTGGMPEVIERYLRTGDIAQVRKTQMDILTSIEQDFSKYTSSSEAIRVSEIWNSIPAQLSKENKKFKYSDVSSGGRSSKYETAIEWLKKANLVNVAYNISKPAVPLPGYAQHNKFKLYLFDTGILGAKLNIESKIIIQGDQLFSEYNGAFTENAAASEIVSGVQNNLYYWTSNSDAEVDFIIHYQNKIYPLEVKSGYSRKKKSLRSYKEKYRPPLLLRLSPRNFTKDDDFCNVPLYAASIIKNVIG
jgi:uncharacterized protein